MSNEDGVHQSMIGLMHSVLDDLDHGKLNQAEEKTELIRRWQHIEWLLADTHRLIKEMQNYA